MGEAAIEDDEPQAVFRTEKAKELEHLALRLAKSDPNDSSAIAQLRTRLAAMRRICGARPLGSAWAACITRTVPTMSPT
jgi:hypothetical protein